MAVVGGRISLIRAWSLDRSPYSPPVDLPVGREVRESKGEKIEYKGSSVLVLGYFPSLRNLPTGMSFISPRRLVSVFTDRVSRESRMLRLCGGQSLCVCDHPSTWA